jgi:uncharacterized NAD(P)/FAD-binding protein YdhS
MTAAPLSIAIIGAGFTAHAAAIALVRKIPDPLQIALIETSDQRGGLAYGRADDAHFLNTRAAQFSIIADRPRDFANWVESSLGTRGKPIDLGATFLPRKMVAEYMHERLLEEVKRHQSAILVYISGEAKKVSRQSTDYRVHLKGHSWLDATHVILATGYGAKKRRPYGLDPFGELGHRRVQKARRVALVGTGLTFMDTLVRLRRLGYQGKAVAISRSGRLPASHARETVRPIQPVLPPNPDLLAIWRAVRKQTESRERGVDWRSYINGIRPDLQTLWIGLSEADKARFHRHVRPLWERLRHRAAPHVHDEIMREIETGRLEIRSGNVSSVRKLIGGWRIDTQTGNDRERLGPFDLVFDCRAPSIDSLMALASPLIKSGGAIPGPYELGLAVTPSGAVIARDRSVKHDLFALGPLGVGSLLEITAAPEIAAQAAAMAAAIHAGLALPRPVIRNTAGDMTRSQQPDFDPAAQGTSV